MAFRQMAGRAGRVSPGLVLYLPALDDRGLPHPVDAFYSNAGNFRELLTGPTERAVVEAANPFLAPRHAERAAFERMVAGLEGPGHASPRHWNLRGEGSAKYHVVEEDAWQKYGAASFHAPLESPAQHYALTEKHVDAMFEQEGQGYRVTRWVPHRDGPRSWWRRRRRRASPRAACTARASRRSRWASGSTAGRSCSGTAR